MLDDASDVDVIIVHSGPPSEHHVVVEAEEGDVIVDVKHFQRDLLASIAREPSAHYSSWVLWGMPFLRVVPFEPYCLDEDARLVDALQDMYCDTRLMRGCVTTSLNDCLEDCRRACSSVQARSGPDVYIVTSLLVRKVAGILLAYLSGAVGSAKGNVENLVASAAKCPQWHVLVAALIRSARLPTEEGTCWQHISDTFDLMDALPSETRAPVTRFARARGWNSIVSRTGNRLELGCVTGDTPRSAFSSAPALLRMLAWSHKHRGPRGTLLFWRFACAYYVETLPWSPVYLNVAYRGRCVEPLYNENRIRGLEWDEKLQKQALKLYGGYAGRSEDAVDELRTALEGIIAQVMREAK
jgi:hypothetical protein